MFARCHLLSCKTFALVVLSLLFSQLSLAAYACPVTSSPARMAEMMAAGAPCEGADADQPGLCHQHGVDLARLFELAQVVVSLSLPAVIHVLLIPAQPDSNDAVTMPPASTPEARPPPDPIFLTTLRLRV